MRKSTLIDVARVGEDVFKADAITIGRPRIFGGSLVGQALAAAFKTVENRLCNSLHGYFLHSGDTGKPIDYIVERVRDGKSFAVRRVSARQDGKPLFDMYASFQEPETGLSHQITMPDVPNPEDCPSEQEYMADNGIATTEQVLKMINLWPVEIRAVEKISYVDPEPHAPSKHMWFRAREVVDGGQAAQQCFLAYATDYGLLGTSALPHGKSYLAGLSASSLDHAIWFYQPVKVNDWLLFAQESPVSSSGRGLNRANLFDQDGVLVASVVQEGLMRES